jgi:hypothetical protein
MFTALFNALRLPSRRELERSYLDAAVSRADLERREREVARGLFRGQGFDL